MATAYTPILQLALPVTGELQGTWGTVVNDNITSMIEQAIAGLATINTWTTASHTLTTANGTTSEARCAVLECSGAPGAAATVICPASTKLYVIKNSVTGGYAVTLKTSAGTGISVPNGSTALLYCDGTNVVSGATYMATVSTTQVDILAQGDLRLQDTTGGEYVALQAPATIATSYTLTLPVDDGTAGQALITDGSGVLSWSTAASGDVYGPASATDNAVARYDGTTGKIIQNSAVTIADDGATVIAANSTTDGLRITQIGTGNALVVEDETNPDATSTVITAAGAVRVGSSTSYNTVYGASQFAPGFQLYNTSGTGGFYRYAADADGAALVFAKSRNATVGSQTVVNSADTLGYLGFAGSDGTNFTTAATITGAVDGTPGTGDMPGRLVFSTTADGASTVTERMRIDSAGKVGIGGTPGATNRVRLAGTSTGNVTQYGFLNELATASDVTGTSIGFTTSLSTTAAAFTLSEIRHFSASFTTIGAGSTITTQYGFYASAVLTGATNNYGFYSAIPSGANRYNFYAAGTASNYFGGNTIVEVTDNTNAALRITQLGTGNALLVEDSANPDATPTVIDNSGRVLVGVDASRTLSPSYIPNLQIEGTTFIASSQSITLNINTAASPTLWFAKSRGATNGSNTIVSANDALGVISFNGADGTDIQSIAAQITASVDGTPGTGDMPGRLVFSTTADGASSVTERMRIDSAGRVGIGGTPTASYSVLNAKAMTGATTEIGYGLVSTIQSDVTTIAAGYRSLLSTQAAAFTLSNLYHYDAVQGTFGATSAVTNQYGFVAGSSLTGATNNYGFYGNIASGTGRYNFYAAGTASNYFEGNTYIGALFGDDTKFAIGGTLPSAVGASYGARVVATVPSGTTAGAQGFNTVISTQAAAFTLAALSHYSASQGTIGASSTVTNQYGFIAQSTLTGATNNYGFLGNIAAATGRYNFYANGTAANYFAGSVGIGTTTMSQKLNVTGASETLFVGQRIQNNNVTTGLAGVEFSSDATYAKAAIGLSRNQVNGGGILSIYNASNTTAADWATTDAKIQIAYNGTISLGAPIGTESLRVTPVASAVNYVEVLGGATGTGGRFFAAGSDASIALDYVAKGATGTHNFYTGATSAIQFRITNTASAVNYLGVTGATTGGVPYVQSLGSDTNVDFGYLAKGTGVHRFWTSSTANTQFQVSHTASAVNYFTVYGGATGNSVLMDTAGTDANVSAAFRAKGTGDFFFYTGDYTRPQFRVAHTATAVNYLQVTGGIATTGFPIVSAQGSDTNIDLALTPKGTGNVRFGTLTANADAPITGYILIKDSGGTTRKLAVIA